MRRSFIALVVVAVLLSLMFCKSDPKIAASPTFKRTANEVVVARIADADVLNPILATTSYANNVNDYIFQYLEYLDPQTGELVPHLAKKKPEIEDVTENGTVKGTKFTFEIREDAVWPNGTPILAEDYVSTLKITFNPKVPAEQFRAYLSSIQSVEVDAENPRRLSIITNKKYFLNEASLTAAIPVMPRYYYDPKGLLADVDLNTLLDTDKAAQLAEKNPNLQAFADFFISPTIGQKPVGSGAYELAEWETGQRMLLKKKADWWGTKYERESVLFAANVDEIAYKVIADNNVAATELKAEQFDVKSSIDPVSFKELSKNKLAKELYNFYQIPDLVYYFAFLNNKTPQLQDKRVRRAVTHLLNVDEIIETIYDGGAQRVNGPAHPSKPYYRKDLPLIPLDVEKAKSLLAEAGWTDTNDNGIVDKEIDGERIEMELNLLISAGRQTNEDLAAVFQKEAIKAGVKIVPVAKESTVMRSEIAARNFHISVSGTRHSPLPWNPKQRFHSESDVPGGSNMMGFRNAAADKIIDAIQLALDTKERDELYRQLLELIYEEQPMIFMFTTNNNMAIHKRFDTKPSGVRPGYFPNTFVLKQ